MQRYPLLFFALLLTGSILAQTTHQVTANPNNTFSPAALTIEVGDTVVWTNNGGFHNVNGTTDEYADNPEGFGNGSASSDAWTYQFVFNLPGVYDYHCDPHRTLNMVGQITVNAPAGEVVISEIMYNPPESETDSLEFVELFNNGDTPVDLTGYTFTAGITATFPEFTLGAGEYVVLALNPDAMLDLFGITALPFEGALSNGGELIELSNPGGTVVTTVSYDDGGAWPTDPDGSGPSLVLCDPDSDSSDGANWSASTTDSGVIINGQVIFASPGAADACAPPVSVSYPRYDVGIVNTVNANGVVDSIGVNAEVQGIVYGVNLRPGGLEFTLIGSDNAGIGVFNSAEDFGYTVLEGDEVMIRGSIGQFNGLTQIGVDTIELVSSGNDLLAPLAVTELGEATESQLIKLENLSLVDPGEWVESGSSFNVSVTDGTNTYLIRIDADVDIAGTPVPVSPFNVTGIGGQFDDSDPFTEGYQMLPRYLGDIEELVSKTVDPTLARFVRAYPNPATDYLQLELEASFDALQLHNAIGQQLWIRYDPQANERLDVSDLPQGLYTLTFVQDSRIWSTQFVKQ